MVLLQGNPGPPGPNGSKGKAGPRGMKVNVREYISWIAARVFLYKFLLM